MNSTIERLEPAPRHASEGRRRDGRKADNPNGAQTNGHSKKETSISKEPAGFRRPSSVRQSDSGRNLSALIVGLGLRRSMRS